MSSNEDADGRRQTPRRTCVNGCGRPTNVCLCHILPSAPLPTTTQIVILQHPHERRHKLATVPILSKCLANCEIIFGRRLRYGDSKILDSLYDLERGTFVSRPHQRALYLFPGSDALPLVSMDQEKSLLDDAEENGHVLIAFDGTWKYAKEMLLASSSFLSKFAIQVCLDFNTKVDGGNIFNSDLILRKEPFSGCMSTMEAVARCLSILEPGGMELESRIIAVLKAMVSFQSSFLNKHMERSPKLIKKVGRKEEESKL